MKELSAIQIRALEAAQTGPLKRLPGGFWATDMMWRPSDGRRTDRFTTGTIRALERRRLLERCHAHPLPWKDSVRLTEFAVGLLRRERYNG